MAGFADVELDAATLQGLTMGDPHKNEAAFATAYQQLASPVLTLAVRLLQDRGGAQEVVQDTFIELLERGHQIRDRAAVVGWVKKVAVNHCLMRLRSPWHSRRVQGLLPEVAADSQQMDANHAHSGVEANGDALAENLPDIIQALGRLGPETRFVVWLHDVEGYTHKEIGELLERTTSYSKSQLARGYETLAKLYQRPKSKAEPVHSNASARATQFLDTQPLDIQGQVTKPGEPT